LKDLPEDFSIDLNSLKSERVGWKPEELITCNGCNRTNAPTRSNCLYCGHELPMNEERRRAPELKSSEMWEKGVNLVVTRELEVSDTTLHEAARILKLSPDEFRTIMNCKRPMPIARASSLTDAKLVADHLNSLGFDIELVEDRDLLIGEVPKRLRTLEIAESDLILFDKEGHRYSEPWKTIILLVAGRIFIKRLETSEKAKKGNSEKEILDSRELSEYSSILDIYTLNGSYRINVESFDFSFLGSEKRLIVSENFEILKKLLRERAADVAFNDSYWSVRHALNPVWQLDSRTEPSGWRRSLSHGFSTGAITTTGNRDQFTRYSRLCNYLLKFELTSDL
jgi:hypothetical protein